MMLESDPDWVPSPQTGHGEGSSAERLPPSKRGQKGRGTAETWTSDESRRPLREPETAGGGAASPPVCPWRDVQALLQSVLQRPANNQQPGDETQQQAAAAKNETALSFRDFFRDALEASLEAASRSRAFSAISGGEDKVELSFKLPALKEVNQASSSSSSSCLNCVRLQRRIMELEEKLSHLPGEQEDMEPSHVSNETLLPPDQDLQSPEAEAEPEWMKPLSPPQCVLPAGDRDVGSGDTSTPAGPVVSWDRSPKPKIHWPPRFRKCWLKMFWFLRYSPILDEMWCHVCRLHADKTHQKLALIKGSRMFKVHNIKKHGASNYHKYNVERYMLHSVT